MWYIVNQIIQANGFSDIDRQHAVNMSTEANKLVTSVVEIANRIRRHRFGTTLTVSDVNEALVSRNMSPLIGYNSSYNVYNYVPIGRNHGKEILAVDEPQISLSSLDKADLPEYPKQVSFDFHWLAYKGIQPKIQENQTYVIFIMTSIYFFK